MLSFFDGSLKDVYKTSTPTVIIVPITDHGFIQNCDIRDIAIEFPELLYYSNRFCEGKDHSTIIYHYDSEHQTTVAFVPCINTEKGINTVEVENFLSMTERCIESYVNRDDKMFYVIQPVVSNAHVFNDTVEEMLSISSRLNVAINYICG